MRIISQDGAINLPYEMTALIVSENYIQAVFAGGIQQSPYVMAVYESREKCQKAMEMLKRFAMKYYPNEHLADEEIAQAGRAVQMFEIEIEHLSGKEVQEK